MYIDLNNGTAVDEAQIRADHPYTTFPIPFAPDPQRYATVKPTAQPEALPGHKVVPGAPVEVAGEWVGVWNQVAMTAKEIEAERKARVPESVAMWQARSVLIDVGLLDDVDAYVAAIPDPVERKKAQAKWEFSNTVRRDDALLKAFAATKGMSEAQIDELFIEAGGLQ